MLAGRHVVLGVSGGVAAYKAALLVRQFQKHGATVKVVMTPSACHFIGPSTFAALTGEDPVVDLFEHSDVSPHTSLGRWADVIVIAPATASTIAKIAHGDSSNALVATVLASTAPVVVAPAMHTEMWNHPATRANVERLTGFGYRVVAPESGELAGGDVGVGRLADADVIVEEIHTVFEVGDMSGLQVLITAGGTREPIDPVRYIGNRSSGKMGNALALNAAERGATVFLVTTVASPDHPSVEVIAVETAQEMAEAVMARVPECDFAVMAAAVADFAPSQTYEEKLRRSAGVPDITLVPTPDVLASARSAAEGLFLVGFAAESGSLDKAAEKAEAKSVDLLVANDISLPGSGFGSETNEVLLIIPGTDNIQLPLMPKSEVAAAIWTTALKHQKER